MDIYRMINSEFDQKEVDVRTYSPLVLAFMGDAVYEMIVRSVVVGKGNRQVEAMHKAKSKLVKAESQAIIARELENEYTEEELDIFKRGRNAKSYTSAKNASIGDYRTATGFEALIGFLYMTGREKRALYLVKKGIEILSKEK